MPLKKSKIDVPLATGLQQKTDPHRLPVGAAAKAINYLKDKNGRLVKRLGFHSLTQTDPLGSGFSLSTGINVGTFQDDLIVAGRGEWAASGATMTVLESWSDDAGGMIPRGPLPDLKNVVDALLNGAPGVAMSPSIASSGDVAVLAFIANTTTTIPPLYGNVWWAAFELSTGTIIIGPTVLFAGHCHYMRLTCIDGTFVLCNDDGNAAGNIYCQTATIAAITSGAGWSTSASIVIAAAAPPFDMRSAGNDSAHFVVAYQGGNIGSGTATIVVEQHQLASPFTTTATWTVATGLSFTLQGIGVRADGLTTNRVVVAYATDNVSAGYKLYAAAAAYPTLTVTSAPAVIYTGTGSGSTGETPPHFVDVAGGYDAGQTNGHFTWTISHSPYQSTWNSAGGGVGTPQNPGNQPPNGAVFSSVTSLVFSQNARIVQNQVFENSGTMAGWGNTSGSNALITAGVTLASRGLEKNGILYFLGWVPSFSQGSFVVLACDMAQLPTNAPFGTGAPMRPVGNLQVRTALADPGGGPGNALLGSPGPNLWTGGSEWALASDPYATAYVAHAGGQRGQRLQPGYAGLQTASRTGCPMAQWGSMTAIGGALPCVFAGQVVTEQGFLWTPESIFATIDLGIASAPPGPSWASTSDSYTWVFTWEQFDEQGNFHISARATITITGEMLFQLKNSITFPFQGIPTFYIPNLGVTMRQWPTPPQDLFVPGRGAMAAPASPVTLGCYRTGNAASGFAQTFLRLNDRFYNGADPQSNGSILPVLVVNSYATGATSLQFADIVSDGTTTENLQDGTHPELYDDGTNGSPGSLDNYCPPASNVMLRHLERLFVARGNQLLFTKQRGVAAGPGYNEQVDACYVGNSDPIVAIQSQDGQLVVLKENEAFYLSGNGPADDGTGTQFSNPQPIPTDLGCVRPEGVISTPEGIYYQSTGGYRRINRSFQVEYVGGPVEDELLAYPDITGAVLYPQNNRLMILANASDVPGASGQLSGELVTRDYVLDAWTTGVLIDGVDAPVQKGFVAATVATALGGSPTSSKPTLHLLTADGVVWRERFPSDATPWFDNNTYVTTKWLSAPMVSPPESQGAGATAQGRFRLWDILAQMISNDAHGLVVSVGTDYGAPTLNRTWVWNSATGAPSIAPGGTPQTPTTQLRTYHGLMGEAFQVQIQDVSDPNSTTGQGATLLGLTVSIGTMPGPYKLPGPATQ